MQACTKTFPEKASGNVAYCTKGPSIAKATAARIAFGLEDYEFVCGKTDVEGLPVEDCCGFQE